MAHATNGRHTDNWWLETLASAVVQDSNGVGTITTSGGGGGGGAATIADGADVTQGAIADAAATAGGTGTLSAKLRAISRDLTNGNQQVQGNVAAAATDSGNPVKVGAKYNTSAPTYTNGQRGDLQIDAGGNLLTREQYAPAYEDNTVGVAKVEQRYTYGAISTATTTTIKSGAGFIHTITLAGGTAGAITVYDNTAGSGTTIIPTFTPGSVSTPVTIKLDVSFSTGLTIVTAAATVITVSYR